ncbi:unnamed protein product [Blepharisma stoltei]|uniref:C2 domain-containing protein n=1 Tax=Blepharisma stoltei TaxID=1481888 RepID=A0AAU9K1H0_9CILI|nr:unnamed protein product [Blepharisma stoltei]
MNKTVKHKLEHNLLNKQILQAEIEQLREIPREIEKQVSIHILAARNLPVQLTSKVSRAVQISIGGKTINTKPCISEGCDHTAKWNESCLLPVTDLQGTVKVLLFQMGTPDKVLGGMMLKLSGFMDQKRHDGWYDIGCGELRLAIRLLHSVNDFYDYLLNLLSPSIKNSENQLKSISETESHLKSVSRSEKHTKSINENHLKSISRNESNSINLSGIENNQEDSFKIDDDSNSDINFLEEDSFEYKQFEIAHMCVRQLSVQLLQKSFKRNQAAKKIQRTFRKWLFNIVRTRVKEIVEKTVENYEVYVKNEVKSHLNALLEKVAEDVESWQIEQFHSTRRYTTVLNQRRNDVIQKLKSSRSAVRKEWENFSKLESHEETPKELEEDPVEFKPAKEEPQKERENKQEENPIKEVKIEEKTDPEEKKENPDDKTQPPYIVAAERGYRRRNAVKRY